MHLKIWVKNVYGWRKNLSNLKTEKQAEKNLNKSFWNIFQLKKENEAIKDN